MLDQKSIRSDKAQLLGGVLSKVGTVTWLHLSDLHLKQTRDNELTSDLVLNALFKDIERFLSDERLQLDFVFLTGDIAFSGKQVEYELAHSFFDQLLKTTGLPKDRLLIIPGNHDIDRSVITLGASAIEKSLTNRKDVSNLFNTPQDRRLVLSGLNNYARFVTGYFEGKLAFDDEHYYYARDFDIHGRRLAILGLNSAWSCIGDEETHSVLVGEEQVVKAINLVKDVDLRIALLHHSFDWLKEFDRKDVERNLRMRCGFILHGHLHFEQIKVESTLEGKTVIIPCGACYLSRDYPNSYNFVHLDLETGKGTTHFRRYSDRLQEWIMDVEATGDYREGRFDFDLSRVYKSTTVETGNLISSLTPSFKEDECRRLIDSFNLVGHFDETIEVEGRAQKAWDYYKSRLQEFIRPMIRLFPKEKPMWQLFLKLELVVYGGGFSTFEHLVNFIKNNAPISDSPPSEEIIAKATLAFTRLVIDRYLKEQIGFDGYLKKAFSDEGGSE